MGGAAPFETRPAVRPALPRSTLIGSGFSNSRSGRNGGSLATRSGHAACIAAARWCCAGAASTARFRDMGVLRQMHDHALATDPRGDAVDQFGQFVIVMHIGIEIVLLLHYDFGAAGREPDQIEAETGIERIAQGIEPLAKQPVDDCALGHRQSGIDRDRAHRRRRCGRNYASSRRAPLPCLSIAATSICASRDKRRRDHLVGRDRLGKTLLHDVIRQRLARIDRRIALPQRLLAAKW